mmetsp:Transcript_124593/g.360347  ORF Transcript_124593/g.360347 Transcript_124593/m.360347 type:complete len:351 (-) Transcript_124593:789-1841(-)
MPRTSAAQTQVVPASRRARPRSEYFQQRSGAAVHELRILLEEDRAHDLLDQDAVVVVVLGAAYAESRLDVDDVHRDRPTGGDPPDFALEGGGLNARGRDALQELRPRRHVEVVSALKHGLVEDLGEDRQVQLGDAQRRVRRSLVGEEVVHVLQILDHHSHLARSGADGQACGRVVRVGPVDYPGEPRPSGHAQAPSRHPFPVQVRVCRHAGAERGAGVGIERRPRRQLRVEQAGCRRPRGANAERPGERRRGCGHTGEWQGTRSDLRQLDKVRKWQRLMLPRRHPEPSVPGVREDSPGSDARRHIVIGRVGVGAAAEDDAVLRGDVDREPIAGHYRITEAVSRGLPDASC